MRDNDGIRFVWGFVSFSLVVFSQPSLYPLGKPASKQANHASKPEQATTLHAGKQARKAANKQLRKQASKQASQPANRQASKPASQPP